MTDGKMARMFVSICVRVCLWVFVGACQSWFHKIISTALNRSVQCSIHFKHFNERIHLNDIYGNTKASMTWIYEMLHNQMADSNSTDLMFKAKSNESHPPKNFTRPRFNKERMHIISLSCKQTLAKFIFIQQYNTLTILLRFRTVLYKSNC